MSKESDLMLQNDMLTGKLESAEQCLSQWKSISFAGLFRYKWRNYWRPGARRFFRLNYVGGVFVRLPEGWDG